MALFSGRHEKTIVRFRFLACMLLAFIVFAPGCKKEQKPQGKGPSPDIKLPAEKDATSETEYLAVFMEGKKVGHAILTRVEKDGQVTTSEDVSLTMNRAGIPITINMSEKSIETTEGEPLGFEVVQLLGAMAMKTKGTVDANGVVHVTSSMMGTETKSTLDWPSGAVMAEGLRLLTEEKGLEEGVEYSAKIFSPGIMQAMDAMIRIGGKQNVNLLGRIVYLTEVTTSMNMPGAGEIVSTSYVDGDLKVQKILVPIAGMQIEMVACAKEFALGKNDVFEVINRLFLKSPRPLGDLGSTSEVAYSLSPVGDDDFNIPSTDNQQVERLEDGKVRVTVKPVSAPAGGTFPYQGEDEAILEAMQPNRFLQSDDERIIKLARKAISSTRDAGEAARRIEAFVADYIEHKDLSVGYASALEVAKSKQGDCSEHAVLAAAMCRAVGIPAQIVTGVVYVDDWSGLQGFGGHAWVQTYIGAENGKWVGLDAAFKGTGRGGYGPGHITLAVGNGEPTDFFNLVTTLGKFKIDKADTKKR